MGLPSALHVVQHQWLLGQSKGQDKKGQILVLQKDPAGCTYGRASASPTAWGQLQAGSRPLEHFMLASLFQDQSDLYQNLSLVDTSSVPRDLNWHMTSFFACTSIRRERAGCKFLQNYTHTHTKQTKKTLGTHFQETQMGLWLVFDGVSSVLLQGTKPYLTFTQIKKQCSQKLQETPKQALLHKQIP